jgi:glucose-6-phosphate isomerase
VGGRFSVSSAVGVLPLALQYGFPVVEQFLAGAHDLDKHFFEAPIKSNLPILLGLLGVWNASFMGHNSRAILPCELIVLECSVTREIDYNAYVMHMLNACDIDIDVLYLPSP